MTNPTYRFSSDRQKGGQYYYSPRLMGWVSFVGGYELGHVEEEERWIQNRLASPEHEAHRAEMVASLK